MSQLTDTLSVPSEEQYTTIHHNNTTIHRIQVLQLGVTDDLAAVKRAILIMPFYLFFVFGVIWGFLFIKGIPELTKQPLSTLYPSVVLLGFGHGLIGFFTIVPWLRRTIVDRENLKWYTVPIVLGIPAGKYKYYSGTFNNWTACDEPPEAHDADAKELKPLPGPQAVTQAGVVTIDNSMAPGQSQVQPPMGYVPVYGSAFGVDENLAKPGSATDGCLRYLPK
jgi:hypothetical protein